MAFRTGNRCVIFDQIDQLESARTVPELVARLQPILTEIAYHVVTGDAAAYDTREEWHTTFAKHLNDELRADRAAAPPKAPSGAYTAPTPPGAYTAAAMAPAPRPAPEHTGNGRRAYPRPAPTHAMHAPAARYPATPGGHLPPALRSIMDGTHPTFQEED